MIICSKCGAGNRDDSKFCENCGNEFAKKSENKVQTDNTFQTMDVPADSENMNRQYQGTSGIPNASNVPSGNSESGTKTVTMGKMPKQKLSGSQVLISIAVVLFVTVVSVVGGKLLGSYMDKEKYGDIEKYIESVRDYTPGEIKGNKYTSDYFGIQVDLKRGWEFDSAEEQEEYSHNYYNGIINEMRNYMADNKISENDMEMLEKSLVVKPEFSATCYDDDEYPTQVIAISYGIYGIEEAADSYSETAKIAGKTFGREENVEYIDAVLVKTEMYNYVKDGVGLMIISLTFSDNDENAEEFFEECIKAK